MIYAKLCSVIYGVSIFTLFILFLLTGNGELFFKTFVALTLGYSVSLQQIILKAFSEKEVQR